MCCVLSFLLRHAPPLYGQVSMQAFGAHESAAHAFFSTPVISSVSTSSSSSPTPVLSQCQRPALLTLIFVWWLWWWALIISMGWCVGDRGCDTCFRPNLPITPAHTQTHNEQHRETRFNVQKSSMARDRSTFNFKLNVLKLVLTHQQ